MVKVTVLGAVNWDISLFVDSFPEEGQQVVINRIERGPGGKGGNVAVAAARLLGKDSVAILAALGNDPIASEQVRSFEEEGVISTGLKFSSVTESGQAYILIDRNGSNTIYSLVGANADLNPEDIDEPKRLRLISEAAVLAVADPPIKTGLKLMREAKARGKPVLWDPGVKSRLGASELTPLLMLVDYLFVNEHEAGYLTHANRYDETADALLKINNRLKVIIKLGPAGSVMFDAEGKTITPTLDLKSHGHQVINTAGCGDSFLGAFASALADGKDDSEALRWANCAAALKATRREVRGSPYLETLLKYLKA